MATYHTTITHNGQQIGHLARKTIMRKRGYYVDNFFRFGTLKAAKQAIDSGSITDAWERLTAGMFNAISKSKGSQVRWEDSPTRNNQ